MLLPLADASERYVYGELERYCCEDLLGAEAAKVAVAKAVADGVRGCARCVLDTGHGPGCCLLKRLQRHAKQFRREHMLTPRELQHVATHVSALLLPDESSIESKLAARRAREPRPRGAAAAPPLPPAALLGPVLLRDAAATATGHAAARVQALLARPDAHRCGLCKCMFGRASGSGSAASSSGDAVGGGDLAAASAPRLTVCGHLFCTACLRTTAHGQGDDEACSELALTSTLPPTLSPHPPHPHTHHTPRHSPLTPPRILFHPHPSGVPRVPRP